MGANRYSCENSFRAIRLLLWRSDSHNMAIFPCFLTSLVILLAVTTTVMLTLGIRRTQTLVTHMGSWCEAIFALSGHPFRAGGGQTWLIYEVKTRPLWRACSRVRKPPGNCFMRHITSQYMRQHDLGLFLPSPGNYPGPEGAKHGSFFRSKPGHYEGLVPGWPSFDPKK